MARFIALNFREVWLAASMLGALGCFSAAWCADAPKPSPAAVKAPATNAAIVKAPATNAPPAIPPKPVDPTMDRYGKILTPGDEMAHTLKLKLPFPGAGEVKVPSPDELNMREKLEQLAKLSDEEIHAQLEQWPAYSKMSLRDQGQMLSRIQDFRDYRARTAGQKARDLGLLALTPDQKLQFEKEYWDKRLGMDHDLIKLFGPVFVARQQKMEEELSREFSASAGPIALGPKPPAPVVPPTNKPPQGAAPATPVKTAVAPDSGQPVAQGKK